MYVSFIKISDTYACIHKRIREDSVIRELMGFPENPSNIEMALRIQKRRKPIDLVADNFPLISFYKLPGQRGYNHLEYTTKFDFDVYTNNDPELAIEIADRISDLFNNQYLNLSKVSSFKGEYLTSAEDDTDLKDVYKYYVSILFTFGIEG